MPLVLLSSMVGGFHTRARSPPFPLKDDQLWIRHKSMYMTSDASAVISVRAYLGCHVLTAVY